MADELKDEMTRITRTLRPDTFRRDKLLIPKDLSELNRIAAALRKIAYDEGADITDGASDDEK